MISRNQFEFDMLFEEERKPLIPFEYGEEFLNEDLADDLIDNINEEELLEQNRQESDSEDEE